MAETPTSKPLRIGIDGRVLMHYEMRGFARYTIELFRAMKELAGDALQLYSFAPGPPAPPFKSALEVTPLVFEASREILWEQSELPKQIARAGVDLFHCTANRGLPYRHVCKYVLTCHDIIDRMPAQVGKENWRARLRKRYADSAARHSADRYITVSEHSKKDICRFHHLPASRVTVIYNAAAPRFHQTLPPEQIARVRDKYRLPPRYFLFLGGFDRRKNVGALLEAFAPLPEDAPALVLAGEHKWEYWTMEERIQSLRIADRVFSPDSIADEDLPALYQGALALVHPSRYEGFGLQLVEAMASGVPVLASDVSSLPEVLDGCGLLFDPADPTTITFQMLRVYREPELRAEMIAAGRKRAGFFSWQKAARQTLDVYAELLGRDLNLPAPAQGASSSS